MERKRRYIIDILEIAMTNLSNEIAEMPGDEEKMAWTRAVRYPLHQCFDEALKPQTRYDARQGKG